MRRVPTIILALGASAAVAWCVALPPRVAAASPPTREPKTDLTALDRKVDQILEQQQLILQQLQAMAEELRIIKVRATR